MIFGPLRSRLMLVSGAFMASLRMSTVLNHDDGAFFNKSVRFGWIGALTTIYLVCVRFRRLGIATGLGELVSFGRATWV